MKQLSLIACFTLFITGCSDDQEVDVTQLPNDPNKEVYSGSLDTRAKRVGYSIGVNIAEMFAQDGLVVDAEAVAKAIDHVLNDKQLLMSRNEISEYLLAEQAYNKRVADNREIAHSTKIMDAGKQYLIENAKKEGVLVLDSGLQYKPIKQGAGKPPSYDDTVVVKYTLKGVDGTVIDSSSSYTNGVSFPVNSVIKGWSEALTRMAPGSRWELAVPPDLAFGSSSSNPQIKPNSALLLDVELISIVNPS
jgi:FKBP-type peptidyl-prolyl cis-trans isomerase FklB